MNKNKNMYKFLIISFSIIIIVSFFAIINKAYSAGRTEYKDWSEVTSGKIQKDFSYSTLFRSEDTQINVINDAGETLVQKDLFVRDNINSGDELVVLITKCATNKNGELLDVVAKINNVKSFSSGGHVRIRIGSSYQIAESQDNPSNDLAIEEYSKVNEPLVFGFGTENAQADFTMTYYKTGTYDSKTDSGTLGNINSSLISNIVLFSLKGYQLIKFLSISIFLSPLLL